LKKLKKEGVSGKRIGANFESWVPEFQKVQKGKRLVNHAKSQSVSFIMAPFETSEVPTGF
jgi:hypothetical protein